MTRDDIVQLFARRQAAWAARDVRALAGTHAAEGIVISPTGGVLEGRADIERVYGVWFSAFPDLRYTQDDLLVDGNRAVQIARVNGTHTGTFFGMEATGRSLELAGAFVMTIDAGLIVHERRIFDFTGVLIQIGVIKARPA